MKFWPWSRFTRYEAEIEALYAKWNETELAEFQAQEAIKDLTRRLEVAELSRKRMSDHIMQLSSKLSQTNSDYIAMRARYIQLEAEINSKVRTSIVLQPPTKHVERKQEIPVPPANREVNSDYDGNALGNHDPLEGLVHTGWPFPTARCES